MNITFHFLSLKPYRCECLNPAEISLPVALSVEKPVQYDESSMQAAQEEQTNPIVLYALAAGCAILLITCIIQGAVLRKKIRKLEEDKL